MSLVSRCTCVYPYLCSQIKKKKAHSTAFFFSIFLRCCTRAHFILLESTRCLVFVRYEFIGLSRLLRACGWLVCKESSFSLESCSFLGYENLCSPRSFQTSSVRDLIKFSFPCFLRKVCSSLSERGWIEKCLRRVYYRNRCLPKLRERTDV